MRALDRFIQEAFEDLAKLPDTETRVVVKLANLQVTLFANFAEAMKEEIDEMNNPVEYARISTENTVEPVIQIKRRDGSVLTTNALTWVNLSSKEES